MNAMIRQFVKTRSGLSLMTERSETTRGPSVILLHGGGQTRHSWKRALPSLAAAGYNAIAYDARGHGESDWAADGDYSFERLAEDLEDVAGSLEGPLILVGASMGGMTAFRVAAEHRLPVAALVLVDIVPNPAKEGGQRIAAFMTANSDGFASVEEAADAVAAYYPERPRPHDVSGLRKNLRLGAGGRLYWHWDPRLLGEGPQPEPPDIAGWALQLAPRITVPVLLVRGERSDVVDPSGVAELKNLLPQTEIVDVAGAGHMIVGDSNDLFNAVIIAFLQRHMSPPKPG